MNEKALCTARELAIGYGKTPLLSDICLGVQPGQILTLIGPNGAGKSTLLRTLAGQLAPMGGTVLLAGKDLTAYTGTERAKKLALMAPHSRRMELTTCFDFVSAGRYPYTGRLGILSAEDRQQVHRALELVGAAHLADRDFNRISDGQRQRILLARALCQQPEVILLDEPTSFLDIKGKIELLTILRELAHTGQLAVILSLHELELAEKIADTVVCVSPGGVSGVLTPEQAFQPENIRTLYGLTEQQYTALFGTPEPEAGKAPAGKPQRNPVTTAAARLLSIPKRNETGAPMIFPAFSGKPHLTRMPFSTRKGNIAGIRDFTHSFIADVTPADTLSDAAVMTNTDTSAAVHNAVRSSFPPFPSAVLSMNVIPPFCISFCRCGTVPYRFYVYLPIGGLMRFGKAEKKTCRCRRYAGGSVRGVSVYGDRGQFLRQDMRMP